MLHSPTASTSTPASPTASTSYVSSSHDHSSPSPSNLWVAKACVDSILDAWDGWDEDETEVLDFACGRGLISQELIQHCKSIVGVDNNQSMVDFYNTSASNNGIPPEEMIAIYRSTFLNSPTELSGRLFDVVVCCQAYHHISDVHTLTLALTSRLKPNGILMVIDLDNQEGFGQVLLEKSTRKEVEVGGGEEGGVKHKGGFSIEGLKEIFESTSQLEEVEVEVSHSISIKEMAALKGKRLGKQGDDLEIRWLIATGIKKKTGN